MLDDHAPAAPYLGFNISLDSRRSIIPALGPEQDPTHDQLHLARSWHQQTVSQYAQRGLWLMTGQRFKDKAAFEQWWKTNQAGRDCLWYWQMRMERDLQDADASTSHPNLRRRPDESDTEYRKRRQAMNQAARAYVHRTIAAELQQRDPEVEAKARLLAASAYSGGAPITGSESQFWPDPPALRISSDRLLDLLDRKALWPDVPWDDSQRGMYNLLTERLGMWAPVLFTPKDVPRLKAAFERERGHLWWSGQAAMTIGISRLLPPADDQTLDSLDTRDGTLRHALGNQTRPRQLDLFALGYCAKELVHTGLPANHSFLLEIAFASYKKDSDNRVGQSILQALAEPPLTVEKKALLAAILMDPRFNLFWTRPNLRGGMDMCREYGLNAINAHAGQHVVDHQMAYRLVDPGRSDEALRELREIIQRHLIGDASQPQAKNPEASSQAETPK